MYKFFAFLDRMKYIKRWSLMRSTREETIMEHTQQVTVLSHALALIKNKMFGGNLNIEKVLLYATYHETGEVITGDLPTPIKYFNPEILNAYKSLESMAETRLLEMLPNEIKEDMCSAVLHDESSEEYKLVKTADKLSAYIKCIEELKVGNGEFKKAEKTLFKDLKKIDSPELNYFMENMLPAYKLTLDELD